MLAEGIDGNRQDRLVELKRPDDAQLPVEHGQGRVAHDDGSRRSGVAPGDSRERVQTAGESENAAAAIEEIDASGRVGDDGFTRLAGKLQADQRRVGREGPSPLGRQAAPARRATFGPSRSSPRDLLHLALQNAEGRLHVRGHPRTAGSALPGGSSPRDADRVLVRGAVPVLSVFQGRRIFEGRVVLGASSDSSATRRRERPGRTPTFVRL